MAANERILRIKDDHLARVLAGEEFLIFDGALGTMIQKAGLDQLVSPPDLLNLERPRDIEAIQRAYVQAGSEVVVTNTFSANSLKLEGKASVAEVFAAAARIARGAGARYVAGDIGPTGALLEPLGTMSFDAAYDVFAEQARAAADAGCDLIVIETMADLREAKAAVLAALENTDLPVFVTMTFGEDGRTFLGTTPAVAAAALSSLGVSAVGVNCSLGPDALLPVVREMAWFARCPLMVQPNAGLPHMIDGETVYDVHPDDFAQAMEPLLEAGATVVGGCCGTTPEFIAKLTELVRGRVPAPRAFQDAFVVTSAQEAVVLPRGVAQVAVIGERINPTGKKKLKEALRAGDYDYVVGEAVAQQKAGADILDVNAGLPDIDEAVVLRKLVETLQSTITLPLQVDSSDPAAVEAAVRGYAGKPLVNSVNGKQSNMDEVLPIVRHYGCAVVGLTLDEDGIPPTAEGRFAVAQRIVKEAESHGIPRSDVAIDCLVMAAATNQAEIREVLRAVTLVKERLGVRTVLGVSNVSFGMPQRNLINATFLAAAFGAGLDMPILNPLAARYRDAVATFRVLNGQDEGAVRFLEDYATAVDPYAVPSGAAAGVGAAAGAGGSGAGVAAGAGVPVGGAGAGGTLAGGAPGASACPIPITDAFADAADQVRDIASLVLSGRAAPMAQATERLLESHDSLAVINEVFVPVLDVVGVKYDKGEFFLPQLMAAAEAVKAGFDVVRERTQGGSSACGAAAAGAGAAAGGGDAAAGSVGAGAAADVAGGMGPDGAGSNAPAGTRGSSSPDRTIIVATVEGDIHDIGKNIVKMLLENYGFPVIDLGRDVPPHVVVEAARAHGVRLVGLSALMTTTVKAMERTIELLHSELPDVSVMVGGAVLTQDYADQIHADFYAKDAAESARIASRFFAEDK